jgi:hypothetical protein
MKMLPPQHGEPYAEDIVTESTLTLKKCSILGLFKYLFNLYSLEWLWKIDKAVGGSGRGLF